MVKYLIISFALIISTVVIGITIGAEHGLFTSDHSRIKAPAGNPSPMTTQTATASAVPSSENTQFEEQYQRFVPDGGDTSTQVSKLQTSQDEQELPSQPMGTASLNSASPQDAIPSTEREPLNTIAPPDVDRTVEAQTGDPVRPPTKLRFATIPDGSEATSLETRYPVRPTDPVRPANAKRQTPTAPPPARAVESETTQFVKQSAPKRSLKPMGRTLPIAPQPEPFETGVDFETSTIVVDNPVPPLDPFSLELPTTPNDLRSPYYIKQASQIMIGTYR